MTEFKNVKSTELVIGTHYQDVTRAGATILEFLGTKTRADGRVSNCFKEIKQGSDKRYYKESDRNILFPYNGSDWFEIIKQ